MRCEHAYSCVEVFFYMRNITFHSFIHYAHAPFDDFDLDTRSQWVGRGKQYLSYGIQTAHGGRLMHDIIYAHVRFDDLDFKDVCKTRPSCY